MIELLLIVLLVIIAMVVIITAKMFAPQFAGLIRSHAGGAPDPNKLAPLSAVVSNNPALWTNIKSAVDVPSFVGAVTTMRDAIIAADLNAAITLKEVTSADIKALWQAKQVCDVFGYISAQDDTTRPCSQDISDLADDGNGLAKKYAAFFKPAATTPKVARKNPNSALGLKSSSSSSSASTTLSMAGQTLQDALAEINKNKGSCQVGDTLEETILFSDYDTMLADAVAGNLPAGSEEESYIRDIDSYVWAEWAANRVANNVASVQNVVAMRCYKNLITICPGSYELVPSKQLALKDIFDGICNEIENKAKIDARLAQIGTGVLNRIRNGYGDYVSQISINQAFSDNIKSLADDFGKVIDLLKWSSKNKTVANALCVRWWVVEALKHLRQNIKLYAPAPNTAYDALINWINGQKLGDATLALIMDSNLGIAPRNIDAATGILLKDRGKYDDPVNLPAFLMYLKFLRLERDFIKAGIQTSNYVAVNADPSTVLGAAGFFNLVERRNLHGAIYNFDKKYAKGHNVWVPFGGWNYSDLCEKIPLVIDLYERVIAIANPSKATIIDTLTPNEITLLDDVKPRTFNKAVIANFPEIAAMIDLACVKDGDFASVAIGKKTLSDKLEFTRKGWVADTLRAISAAKPQIQTRPVIQSPLQPVIQLPPQIQAQSSLQRDLDEIRQAVKAIKGVFGIDALNTFVKDNVKILGGAEAYTAGNPYSYDQVKIYDLLGTCDMKALVVSCFNKGFRDVIEKMYVKGNTNLLVDMMGMYLFYDVCNGAQQHVAGKANHRIANLAIRQSYYDFPTLFKAMASFGGIQYITDMRNANHADLYLQAVWQAVEECNSSKQGKNNIYTYLRDAKSNDHKSTLANAIRIVFAIDNIAGTRDEAFVELHKYALLKLQFCGKPRIHGFTTESYALRVLCYFAAIGEPCPVKTTTIWANSRSIYGCKALINADQNLKMELQPSQPPQLRQMPVVENIYEILYGNSIKQGYDMAIGRCNAYETLASLAKSYERSYSATNIALERFDVIRDFIDAVKNKGVNLKSFIKADGRQSPQITDRNGTLINNPEWLTYHIISEAAGMLMYVTGLGEAGDLSQTAVNISSIMADANNEASVNGGDLNAAYVTLYNKNLVGYQQLYDNAVRLVKAVKVIGPPAGDKMESDKDFMTIVADVDNAIMFLKGFLAPTHPFIRPVTKILPLNRLHGNVQTFLQAAPAANLKNLTSDTILFLQAAMTANAYFHLETNTSLDSKAQLESIPYEILKSIKLGQRGDYDDLTKCLLAKLPTIRMVLAANCINKIHKQSYHTILNYKGGCANLIATIIGAAKNLTNDLSGSGNPDCQALPAVFAANDVSQFIGFDKVIGDPTNYTIMVALLGYDNLVQNAADNLAICATIGKIKAYPFHGTFAAACQYDDDSAIVKTAVTIINDWTDAIESGLAIGVNDFIKNIYSVNQTELNAMVAAAKAPAQVVTDLKADAYTGCFAAVDGATFAKEALKIMWAKNKWVSASVDAFVDASPPNTDLNDFDTTVGPLIKAINDAKDTATLAAKYITAKSEIDRRTANNQPLLDILVNCKDVASGDEYAALTQAKAIDKHMNDALVELGQMRQARQAAFDRVKAAALAAVQSATNTIAAQAQIIDKCVKGLANEITAFDAALAALDLPVADGHRASIDDLYDTANTADAAMDATLLTPDLAKNARLVGIAVPVKPDKTVELTTLDDATGTAFNEYTAVKQNSDLLARFIAIRKNADVDKAIIDADDVKTTKLDQTMANGAVNWKSGVDDVTMTIELAKTTFDDVAALATITDANTAIGLLTLPKAMIKPAIDFGAQAQACVDEIAVALGILAPFAKDVAAVRAELAKGYSTIAATFKATWPPATFVTVSGGIDVFDTLDQVFDDINVFVKSVIPPPLKDVADYNAWLDKLHDPLNEAEIKKYDEYRVIIDPIIKYAEGIVTGGVLTPHHAEAAAWLAVINGKLSFFSQITDLVAVLNVLKYDDHEAFLHVEQTTKKVKHVINATAKCIDDAKRILADDLALFQGNSALGPHTMGLWDENLAYGYVTNAKKAVDDLVRDADSLLDATAKIVSRPGNNTTNVSANYKESAQTVAEALTYANDYAKRIGKLSDPASRACALILADRIPKLKVVLDQFASYDVDAQITAINQLIVGTDIHYQSVLAHNVAITTAVLKLSTLALDAEVAEAQALLDEEAAIMAELAERTEKIRDNAEKEQYESVFSAQETAEISALVEQSLRFESPAEETRADAIMCEQIAKITGDDSYHVADSLGQINPGQLKELIARFLASQGVAATPAELYRKVGELAKKTGIRLMSVADRANLSNALLGYQRK